MHALLVAAEHGSWRIVGSDAAREYGFLRRRASCRSAFMATECGGAEPDAASHLEPALRPDVKSFAVIMHDPDAPIPGGFYHWVVYNLPATIARA